MFHSWRRRLRDGSGLKVGLPLLSMLIIALVLAVLPQAQGKLSADDDSDEPDGMEIFRFDTFGDERFWTDKLRLHRVIESTLDPLTALQLGLRVDAEALTSIDSVTWPTSMTMSNCKF